MRRILLWVLLSLLVLVVAPVALVIVRTGDVEALPPPDPALPIELPDGERLPLAEVLDRARAGLPLRAPAAPVEPLLPSEASGEPSGESAVYADAIYTLAEQSRAAGKLDQAPALYLSIPHGNVNYSRARRIVAWNILARDMHKPEWAVKYANQALHADPFDGNAWQDWYRVYARTLGLPVR